ncbi:MAG: (2Fe-2S)-binding protein [Clostridium sp.]
MPIWFKQDADPKYICYCNKVTEQEIIDAVINKGAKDMKDIIRLTGAMKNARCEVNNPLGKCCGSVIQETIDKALSIK